MYVTRVPNRGSPPAVLLRESYREDGKVKTRTLANLSRWPERKVDNLQRALKGLPSARDLPALRAKWPYNPAFMHPAELERNGLAPGDLIEIRWQSEVEGIRQTRDGVELDVRTPSEKYALAAGWVWISLLALSVIRETEVVDGS